MCIRSCSPPHLPLNWDQINGLPGCYYRDSDFCFLDSSTEGEYVDLIENPERFTGYTGPAAHRVWNAIYHENCFGQSEATWSPSKLAVSVPDTLASKSNAEGEGTCMEKRVFYRVISGLHTSISTHICMEYFNQTTGTWVCGPPHPPVYAVGSNSSHRRQTSNVSWIESVYILTDCNRCISIPFSSCERFLASTPTCQRTTTVRQARTKRMFRLRAFLGTSLTPLTGWASLMKS